MKENSHIDKIIGKSFFLGGSPCSGKSTIAEMIATQHRMVYYNVDDHYQEHVARCDPDLHPNMYNISNMAWDEIWSRPVEDQVEEELEYYRELFGMILQDLGEYSLDKPLIVEGAALLPELIQNRNVEPDRVLFMVPTMEFQLYHYSRREFIHHILKECKDPETAFENWMMRDHLFGKEVLHQAKKCDYKTILVDGERGIADQFVCVRNFFGLS